VLTPAPAWNPVGAIPVQLTVWPLTAEAEFGTQSAQAGEAISSVANVPTHAPINAGAAQRRPPDRPAPMVPRITQPKIQRTSPSPGGHAMDFIIEPGNQPEMAIFSMAACVSWGVLIFCITSGSFDGFATADRAKSRHFVGYGAPMGRALRPAPAEAGPGCVPACSRPPHTNRESRRRSGAARPRTARHAHRWLRGI
jgi:hypothetical protein